MRRLIARYRRGKHNHCLPAFGNTDREICGKKRGRKTSPGENTGNKKKGPGATAQENSERLADNVARLVKDRVPKTWICVLEIGSAMQKCV